MFPKKRLKIRKPSAKGIPVALVSRCFNGIAEPVYAYQGGGVQLQKAGVFFVKELNAQKARLKLLIALNAGLTGTGFERLYGRVSLFSRKQNQEICTIP